MHIVCTVYIRHTHIYTVHTRYICGVSDREGMCVRAAAARGGGGGMLREGAGYRAVGQPREHSGAECLLSVRYSLCDIYVYGVSYREGECIWTLFPASYTLYIVIYVCIWRIL
jgi:hypothetical protein